MQDQERLLLNRYSLEQQLVDPETLSGRPILYSGHDIETGSGVLVKLWPRRNDGKDLSLQSIWQNEVRQLQRLAGYAGAREYLVPMKDAGNSSSGFYVVLNADQRLPLKWRIQQPSVSKQETLVRFDQYHLVLMPKTKDYTQSIHIDLHTNQLTDKQGLTVINRFLSVLTWCDDQFAVAQDGWSGNPVPVPVSKRDLAFATAHVWVFDRRISKSDVIRRALALYREGRNAEEAALGSYAVLSYFKVIEIKYQTGDKAKRWIGRNFALISSSSGSDPQIKHFIAASHGRAPEDYIYEACRVAVAHASTKHPSDADEADEITRLYSASYVLRLLARRLITEELGVSDSFYSGD